MGRSLSALLAAMMAGNGVVMLAAGRWWYVTEPGVTTMGPYNPHFVKDIGAAYLVVALGLGWSAARPRQGWPALVCAAAFLSLHALIHVADTLAAPTPWSDVVRDLPGVYAPPLIALALTLLPSMKGASHAESLA